MKFTKLQVYIIIDKMDESDLLQNHQARVKQQTAAYKKIKVLGEGSMGKAYLVESNIDHQLYVMKRINIGHLSPEQKQLAMRQAQLHSLVHHPNIIAFKQIYHTTGDKLCIIMEYAQNGDLDQFIQQQNGKLLNEEIVLYYFTQICLGLKEIHSKKIIHRDLKGANIFLSKNNTVKIGDFGISKVIDQTVQASKSFVGTPYYLSPQMVQGKPYSTKADIWALGVILYNLCSQKLPFQANSLPLLALRILKGSYPPLTGPYSKQMKILISSMLQTDAKKRPNITQILMKPLLTKFIPKQEAEKLEQLKQKPRITKTSTVANLASPTITGQSIKTVKPIQKSNKAKLSQQQKRLKQKQLKEEKKKKRDEQFKQMKEDIRKKRMQTQKQKVSSAGFITDQAPNASKQLQKKLTQLPKSPSKVKSQEQTKPFVEKPWKTVKNKGQIKKDVEVEILLPSTKPKQHKKQQPIVPIDFKIQIKQYGKKPVSMGDISQDLTKLSPQNINKIKNEQDHSQQQDSYDDSEGQIEQIEQQYQDTQESHQGGKTDFQSMMNQLKHAQNTVNGLKNYNSKQIQLYEESQNFDDQNQKDQQHSQKTNSARMPEMNTMQQHSWNAINGSDNLQQCRQILQEGLGQQRFMKAYHILNQHLDQSQRKKMRGEELQGYTFNRQVLRQKLDFLTDKQFHDYVILMYTVIVIEIEQMRKNLDD